MPFCEVNRYQKTEDGSISNNAVTIFYQTYGRGFTKVLLIIGTLCLPIYPSIYLSISLSIYLYCDRHRRLSFSDFFEQDWRVLTIHGVHRSKDYQGLEPQITRRELVILLQSPPSILSQSFPAMTQGTGMVSQRAKLIVLRCAVSIIEEWVAAPRPKKNHSIRKNLSRLVVSVGFLDGFDLHYRDLKFLGVRFFNDYLLFDGFYFLSFMRFDSIFVALDCFARLRRMLPIE